MPLQPAAELGRPTHLIVAGDPGVGQPLQQVHGDPPRLTELDLLRDMAPGATIRVVRPALGKVEPPVQRRVVAGAT
jgi:hypothetical protein